MEYEGVCLKQDSVTFLQKNRVNVYITYKLDTWSKDLITDFTPGNCLFRAVKLTKNSDPKKYEYSSYGIGFDSTSQFSWTDGRMGENVFLELRIVLLRILMDGSIGENVIFGVDNSSPVHIDGTNKNTSVLCGGSAQGLDNAAITAKAEYPINFAESGKRMVLSLHYNENNSFLFVNAVEIKPSQLCVVNISKDFTIDNMKKPGLKGSVKVFSVAYNPAGTSNVFDIHRFLMKET